MKLFRQKDELFELMARGAERRRTNPVITTPSRITTKTPTTAKLPRPLAAAPSLGATPGSADDAPTTPTAPTTTATTPATPTATATTTVVTTTEDGPTLDTVTPKPPLYSTPSLRSRPHRPPPSLGPIHAGGPAATSTPRTAPRAAPSLTTTTRKLGVRSPLLAGASPEDDFFDVGGDALVVVDDGWEEANAVTGPEKTFAIRADTAVVGGLLAGGLLLGAFLIGRTSSSPEAPAERPITPVVITAQANPAEATTLPASVPVAATGAPAPVTLAASVPAPTASPATTPTATPGAAPAIDPSASTTVAAGFQPQAQASTEARQANPGKYEIRVCTTTPEKAQSLSKWLNEAPRSPIFGRGDLQVVVNGGSVKIQGFMQREADVLSRVRATSDPTGGSGTFHDAYFASVR